MAGLATSACGAAARPAASSPPRAASTGVRRATKAQRHLTQLMDHAESISARTRQLFAEQRGGEALRQLRVAIDATGRSALSAELERCIADSLKTADQRHRSYADLRAAHGDQYKPVQVLAAAETLARCDWFAHALTLLDLAHAPDASSVAHQRAQWAMRVGDYAQVVAASELAITALLRVPMPFESLLTRALERTPPEQLLCFGRDDIARLARLRMPFVLHWEASHRLGRRDHAAKLRELCLAFWPERRSVWEAAGQHALDDEQHDAADGYFARALSLDASSVTALAGRAIVREARKDWQGALPLRRAVADNTDAWHGTDAASLHRVIRYAADLGRLGRWREAAPHFEAALHADAFQKLSPERGVLLRVFSEELYAPAAVADMLAEAPGLAASASVGVACALRDALQLDQLGRRAQVDLSDPFRRALALGMLASQAGDAAAAHAWFNAAHTLSPSHIIASYLAASHTRESATSTGPAAESARTGAPAVPPSGVSVEAISDDLGESAMVRYFAELARARDEPTQPAHHVGVPHLDALLALVAETVAGVREAWEGGDLPEYEPANLFAQLLWWTALREACVASGQLPSTATRVCAQLRRSAPFPPFTQDWRRGAWHPAWRDMRVTRVTRVTRLTRLTTEATVGAQNVPRDDADRAESAAGGDSRELRRGEVEP